jgi:hypothetical protein
MAAPAAGDGDWLATICPYLASADGAYRSATADEGNRCTAQDPPATLPLAFQERYCLTDRHTRCEMYKFAREAGTDEAAPAETVAAVGTRPLRVARPAGGRDGVDRRLIAGAAGLGGVIVLVVVLVLLMGSCSSQPPGAGDGASLDPAGSAAAAATDTPTETPTPRPTEDSGPSPDASAATTGDELIVRYEVQEGEALLAIAETFETTRRRLWRMNEGLEAIPPAELPGQVILVPVPSTMTAAELEAIAGYLGPAAEA